MTVNNKTQLITYPNSLGGDLKKLHNHLNNSFTDLFDGGVHILPPFPSSGDRGFSPLTYFEISEEFGTWEDLRTIGEDYDILIDFMVNHISQQSEYFQDFLENGMTSKYSDVFLTLDKIWEDGQPVQEDIDKMFLRRETPYSTFKIKKNDKNVNVWTTFGKEEPSEQIDLDVNSEETKEIINDIFKKFSENNIKIVRLDAVGYVIKKIGTSCFFVEPEIYEFLDWINTLANSYNIELLPEVHAEYQTQFKLAEKGFRIYDFILPYMILETLMNKRSYGIIEYLKMRPSNQFTMLDCHDGVPVLPDMEGLINIKEAKKVVDLCVERGSNLSHVVSDEHKAEDGFDVHQIGGTYYSLLGENDDAYIAARAIQFFTPGIPQVYYVGLLAGKNDYDAVEETGEIRAINRHNYTDDEIQEALELEVVKRLFSLIKFRNEYSAFDGDFYVEGKSDSSLHMYWIKGDKECHLYVDLETYKSKVTYSDDDGYIESYIL